MISDLNADMVTFTEEILNGKHFLCIVKESADRKKELMQ